jgi:hypothetical protein
MARPLIVLSIFLALAGCVPQQQATAPAPLPEFRDPRAIKPAAIYSADAAPAYVPPSVTATSSSRPVGKWAPPVSSRRWQYIVIHHSASYSGNAATFDKDHRNKGWDELGYHFVIDNGNGGPDGKVEIGTRWSKQKQGAHAKTARNEYNEVGIGICLVGNFEAGRPTALQQAALTELVAWLMDTYDIPASRVMGHRDTGRQTLCPGRNMNITLVRNRANEMLARTDEVEPVEDAVAVSGTELLISR